MSRGLGLRSSFPPARDAPISDSARFVSAEHLPLPRNRLIGRARDLAALRDQLRRRDVPLVTLTGPAGVGKTRLALHVTHDLRAEFADGVGFVPRAGRLRRRVCAGVGSNVDRREAGVSGWGALLTPHRAGELTLSFDESWGL